MKNKYTYRAYNLIFSSELLIPELEMTEGTPDVVIKLGQVPASLLNPTEKRKFFQSAPDEFLIRLDNIAGFYVTNGKEITLEPYIDRDAPDIRLFLLGSVFGALLQQRGYLTLHGASVVINGKGILFTGKAGIGKSTLAAAFHSKGFRILTDDVCAIKIGEDKLPYIKPGFPSLKLWKDAADKLGRNVDGLEPVKKDMDKYRVNAESQCSEEPIALSEIYILGVQNSNDIEILPVKDMDRIMPLIRNTYRYHYLHGHGMKPLHFKQCAAVAGKVRIFRVLRPETGFLLDELVRAIEENERKQQ
ncbi:MAG: hypothetical protein WA705_23965 [Candidatus Ozemobacteraceae bacterium]